MNGAILKKIRGFTLVELLVVIAIIGLLVGLLLPAVQSARESARRSNCVNKLRQISLAVLNFHDARARFPTGAVIAGGSSSGGGICTMGVTRFGAPWTIMILPFIEQQTLYDSFDLNGEFAGMFSIEGGRSQAAKQQVRNPTFECSSDPNATSANMLSNYLAVSGGCSGTSDTGCCATAQYGPKYQSNNGIFFTNSSISVKDVTDGTSKTFLLGETKFMPLSAINGAYWSAWSSGYYNPGGGTDVNTPTMAVALDPINASTLNPGKGQGTYKETSKMFGSNHPGGTHHALADGAVRFVMETMDMSMYRAMARRADGLPSGDGGL
ncbi:DUF1559 domain-containing protein [bacterium]|nr:DUF1559 domain-containing protein [bacterium]